MIEYRKMNITTVDRGVVVHGVNCQLRMGSGVAGAIKRKWPKVYDDFMNTEPRLGKTVYSWVGPELVVASCYTQENYGYDGKRYASLGAISWGLRNVQQYVLGLLMEPRLDVYMPRIGCGLGGLDWKEVEPLIPKHYPEYDVKFIVCDL